MTTGTVAVIDFRRRRLALQWDLASGAWVPLDEPPAIVHGVAYIRATGPNICLFASGNELKLQIDARVHPLSDPLPRISCPRSIASLGLRRRFRLATPDGTVLFRTAYWAKSRNDFFLWLATAARQPDWFRRAASRWTDGITPAELREEVNPPAPQP